MKHALELRDQRPICGGPAPEIRDRRARHPHVQPDRDVVERWTRLRAAAQRHRERRRLGEDIGRWRGWVDDLGIGRRERCGGLGSFGGGIGGGVL
jgi:hypothetical protein